MTPKKYLISPAARVFHYKWLNAALFQHPSKLALQQQAQLGQNQLITLILANL